MTVSLLKKYISVCLVFVLLFSSIVHASLRSGDINSDGLITADDAAVLLTYILDPVSVDISDEVLQGMDVNMDAMITAADCSEIMYKSLNSAYLMPIERDEPTSGPAVETTTRTESTTFDAEISTETTTVDISTETTTTEATESTTADLNSIYASGYTFSIGQDELSLPDASTVHITPDGIKWYAYDEDYLHYTRVGTADGNVVKIVTYDVSAGYDGVNIGDLIGNAAEPFIDYSYTRVSESRLYIDTNDSNKVYAIMLRSRSYYSSELDYSAERCQAMGMQIADDTNAFRAQHGLRDLVWNPVLAEVAQEYAVYMAENSYFDHIDPEGQGPGERMENAGLIYSYFGENINAGYYNTENSINGWVNSAGHRANMLDENFTQIGAGAAYNPDDELDYYTRGIQNFFTPLR